MELELEVEDSKGGRKVEHTNAERYDNPDFEKPSVEFYNGEYIQYDVATLMSANGDNLTTLVQDRNGESTRFENVKQLKSTSETVIIIEEDSTRHYLPRLSNILWITE